MYRIFSIITMGAFLSGCTIVPWYISAAHTAGDVVLSSQTGKSSTEHLVSKITKKDCQWARTLYLEKACMTRDEEIEYMLSMNCELYVWNWLGLPECGKLLDKSN